MPKLKAQKEILSALANQDRLDILCLLKEGEKNVSQIVDAIGKPQTYISQGLQQLTAAGFIGMRKEGKFRFYALNNDFAEPFLRAAAPDEGDVKQGHLRSVIEQAPLSITVFDREGRYTFIGGGAMANYKGAGDFLLGQSVLDIYRDRADITGFIRRSLAGEIVTWTIELNGHITDITSTPYRDETGMVAGVINVAYDVSARLEQERLRATREAGDHWRQLVESSPDIIVQLDRDGKVMAINHAFNGLERSSVIGSSIHGYVRPESRNTMIVMLAGVFAAGLESSFEVCAAGKGLTPAKYDCRIVPFKSNGAVMAATVTMREIGPA